MRDMPKRLNTPQDVQNCLQLFPEETKRLLKSLYENRFTFEVDRDKSSEESTVVTREEQIQKVEDPQALIFKLGLTKEQIEELVSR